MTQSFDAIIIGSGQAGNPLAHNLADNGWKVALIEREHLGGSCINYGCTPTKTMIASAQVAQSARRAHEYGVNVGKIEIDLAKVVERKNKIVLDWRQGQEKQANKRDNITLLRGEGSFVDAKTVRVNDKELTAPHIFINTGARPLILPIDGLDDVDYLTNRNIMDLTEVPEHLIVIGGSYIGLEFGQMFRRFGSEVTIIEFADQIMHHEDDDIAQSLREALEEEGIKFRVGCQVTAVEKDDNAGLKLTVKDRKTDESHMIKGSHLLLAAGREPNTDVLNLEAAGIEADEGWIVTNEYLETSVEGIYALGDVKGGPAFTHISYNDFQIVFHNLTQTEADKLTTNDRLVPYALFTEPELGRVGLTEKEAREQGYNIMVGSIPMKWVARAIEMNQTQGMMKIIVDADTELILGAAILGPVGGELVQTLMALMMAKASWKIFYQAMFIHPTLTEGFFSLFDQIS